MGCIRETFSMPLTKNFASKEEIFARARGVIPSDNWDSSIAKPAQRLSIVPAEESYTQDPPQQTADASSLSPTSDWVEVSADWHLQAPGRFQ
jgi:hypothetical protein